MVFHWLYKEIHYTVARLLIVSFLFSYPRMCCRCIPRFGSLILIPRSGWVPCWASVWTGIEREKKRTIITNRKDSMYNDQFVIFSSPTVNVATTKWRYFSKVLFQILRKSTIFFTFTFLRPKHYCLGSTELIPYFLPRLKEYKCSTNLKKLIARTKYLSL